MLSSYLVDKLADKIISNTDFTVTIPYFSLHTATPGTSGASELTAGSEGGSYSRQSCASWDTSLPRLNTAAISWTNTPYSTVTHWGMWDAASGGNFLMGGTLVIPINLFLGETVRFSAGRLSINCESRFSTYLKPKILDKLLKNTDFTVSTTYMSVHTADPGATGTGEVTGSGPRSDMSASLTIGSPSLATNTWTVEAVTSGTPNAIQWNDMPDNIYSYLGVWDASSSGNFLLGGALSAPVTTSGGNSTIVLDVGDSAFFKFTQVP